MEDTELTEATELKKILEDLQSSINSTICNMRTKDATIVKLSDELRDYRKDFAYCCQAKLLHSIISLRESFKKEQRRNKDDLTDIEKAKRFLGYLPEEVLQVLDDFDVFYDKERSVYLRYDEPIKSYLPRPVCVPKQQDNIMVTNECETACETVASDECETVASDECEAVASDECEAVASETIDVYAEIKSYCSTLLAQFAEYAHESNERDILLNTCISELEAYDEYNKASLLRPMLTQLCSIHKTLSSYNSKILKPSFSLSVLQNDYFCLLDRTVALLTRLLETNDVEIISHDSGMFNRNMHAVVNTIPIDDTDEHVATEIAVRHTDCYMYKGRLFEAMKVDVYVANTK